MINSISITTFHYICFFKSCSESSHTPWGQATTICTTVTQMQSCVKSESKLAPNHQKSLQFLIWRTKNQARDQGINPTQEFDLFQINPNWLLGNWTFDPSLKWALARLDACALTYICRWLWALWAELLVKYMFLGSLGHSLRVQATMGVLVP
jgi:hypothetical protein